MQLPEEWSTAREPFGIPIRKALGLKMVLDNMPLFIGEKELIVGTRTIYGKGAGGSGTDPVSDFSIYVRLPYLNQKDIELFGCDLSYCNKTHYTPDYGILLSKGIGGILQEVEERKKDSTLTAGNLEFLESVKICYTGLQNLILRYSQYALELAREAAEESEKERLLEIGGICEKISTQTPDTFREAVQLLWFGYLGMIAESFEFVNYGRLDVILNRYLKGTPKEEAQQLLECLLIKMYDQVDIRETYLGDYAAQLVVTLGGVLPDGESAVNDVTMMFLEAIDHVRFPEPEFNLRISSVNPPEFLERAAQLTVSGRNNVSYYNDDLYIDSMVKAGIPVEEARNYGFGLCQDIVIPGRSDFNTIADPGLAFELMEFLLEQDEFETFDELMDAFKGKLARKIQSIMENWNRAQEHMYKYRDEKYEEYFAEAREKNMLPEWGGRSAMAPLPYLSALFHGPLEKAQDLIFDPLPLQHKGIIIGTSVETMNSLAAIKKVVYDTKQYTLRQVVDACRHDYQKEGEEVLRNLLWNAPKWGNDDDYVDSIGVDLLEYFLKVAEKYRTFTGHPVLGGIHQAHPVPTGKRLMATPEGRHAGMPVAVTLTAETGTMRNGPTAALKSAAKIDHELIQWNCSVMVNYFASVFRGNSGKEVFKRLLKGYFAQGGLQHQPNVQDVEELRQAQLHPEDYQDLIVRLWGVSAHFVNLPRELQDEMIARFT